MPQDLQQLHGAIGILHTGSGDDHAEEQPKGIHDEMALAPLHLFASVIATDPPCSVVFTD